MKAGLMEKSGYRVWLVQDPPPERKTLGPREIDNFLTKRWNPAYDARERIRALACADRETVDAVLNALFHVVYSDLKTTLVGLAKFEWKPLRTKLPDGTPVTTRRLVVTPSRYHAIPAKDRPVMGKPGVPGGEGNQ